MRALMTRGTPRDIYDTYQIETFQELDRSLWRKVSLFYISLKEDARKMNTDHIDAVTKRDMQNHLVPMLSSLDTNDAGSMKERVRLAALELLELTGPERDYFDSLYTKRSPDFTLLFEDPAMHELLMKHPGVAWRLQQLSRR